MIIQNRIKNVFPKECRKKSCQAYKDCLRYGVTITPAVGLGLKTKLEKIYIYLVKNIVDFDV